MPDLHGCVAVEDTFEATLELIAEAIEFHIEPSVEDSDRIPSKTSVMKMVEVRGWHSSAVAEVAD